VAVVGEPSELEITYCQRGAVWYEWVVSGKTGLTGRPGSINAVHKAVKLASALIDLNERLEAPPHPLVGRPQLSVNLMDGGTQFYNVPDRCVLKTDRRLVPTETTGGAIAQIENIAETLRSQDPELEFTMERKLEIPPVETPIDSAIVHEAMAAIREVRGRDPQLTGMFGFTEMAHIHQAGIPVIVCGPGSLGVIHAPDEYVEVDEFMEAIAIYTSLARRVTAGAA
jgi:acetylornithine deacetylase/succinyl-diaminopimelate desuccinylase-like protein